MNRYIIPIFLVLVSVGVFVMYVDPLYASIQSGNVKIAEYDELILDAQEATTKILKLKATQSQFPAGYDLKLATILPASVDPLRLVIDVNGIAGLRGLQIKSPSVSVPQDAKKKEGELKKNVLTFTVSAPYDVFISFLKDIESSLALQDLSTLNFSAQSNSQGSTDSKNLPPELRIYDYQVSLITYSLPN